jgi:4-amino-4-deoxy-L-arabinose transferase-like glycosyltransferase
MFTAAVLAMHGIGSKSLWLDEAVSARIAQMDIVQGVRATYTLPEPGSMALYYIVLHFWSFLSSSETWLRLLSTVFAVAAVPAVWVLSLRIVGKTTAATAAALVAMSPFIVSWAQQARPYTFVVLISALLTLTFYSAMKNDGSRRWLAFAVVAAVGLYFQTIVAYLIAALGCVAALDLLDPRRRTPVVIRSRAAAAAIIVLAGLPLTAQLQFIKSWSPPLTVQSFVDALQALVGGRTLFEVVVLSVLALPVVGLWWLSRRRALEFSILIAASILPIVFILLVSVLHPMFLGRYLAMAVPGLALVVSAAVDLLAEAARASIAWIAGRIGGRQPKWASVTPWVVGVGALLIIVTLSARSEAAWYDYAGEDWRSATEFISANAQPTDTVIVYPYSSRVSFDYYAMKSPTFAQVAPLYPAVAWGMAFPKYGPSLAHSLAESTRTGRIWIVYRSGDGVGLGDALLIKSYTACGRTVSKTQFPGVEVDLVELPPEACTAPATVP